MPNVTGKRAPKNSNSGRYNSFGHVHCGRRESSSPSDENSRVSQRENTIHLTGETRAKGKTDECSELVNPSKNLTPHPTCSTSNNICIWTTRDRGTDKDVRTPEKINFISGHFTGVIRRSAQRKRRSCESSYVAIICNDRRLSSDHR